MIAAIGEPRRKLEINARPSERNNENSFNLNDLLQPAQAMKSEEMICGSAAATRRYRQSRRVGDFDDWSANSRKSFSMKIGTDATSRGV